MMNRSSVSSVASKSTDEFSSGSSEVKDDGYSAKQCLEPLVDWSLKHQKGEYRMLWFLGGTAAIFIVASIIVLVLQSETGVTSQQSGIGHNQNPSIPEDPTMTPSLNMVEVESNDSDPFHDSTMAPQGLPTQAPSTKSSQLPDSTTAMPSMINSPPPDSTTTTAIPSIAMPQPISRPTSLPTTLPTTTNPSRISSNRPSMVPRTATPTSSRTGIPASQPTKFPSRSPTSTPTTTPAGFPSSQPTKFPSRRPTSIPTTTPARPTVQPTFSSATLPPHPTSYNPGNLTILKFGLLLSGGLNARLLANTGNKVVYADGSLSERAFHGQPDAGATFPDPRPDNPGGWIYVSNSEMPNLRTGGVGALTFDKFGNTIDYRMVLEGTSMNCGGGRTPWNTWVSCEEIEFDGLIYQVDPTGAREAQLMTLGSAGGRWESFAYDIRDRARPHYYATEDHNKGTVRRFTPDNPDWSQPWDMLHGSGVIDYLIIFPNSRNDGGTFAWTNDKKAAKNNARSFYPQTEGIDVYGSQMFFVCKRIQQLFTLNLDDGTYSNRTTVSGLFDGKPDQMQRILGDENGLLYFTEEGGVDAGVHARDHLGRYYTILESPRYKDETTGLSFSPDGRFLYVAYQANGLLFAVWRNDGKPFQASHLDVKFHQPPGG